LTDAPARLFSRMLRGEDQLIERVARAREQISLRPPSAGNKHMLQN
jgi:hypothetical protein